MFEDPKMDTLRNNVSLMNICAEMALINGDKNEKSITTQTKSLRKDEEIVPFSIFLGGSCNPTTWRTELAIPILKKLGITYYNPQRPEWAPELIDLEDRAKKIAKVLLFVIDNKTRSVSSMIEAAHCIGSHFNVVLCIQELESNCVVDGEKLSRQAIEDQNRGRAYLTDIAKRAKVPVFTDIVEAIKFAANKCTQSKTTTTSTTTTTTSAS